MAENIATLKKQYVSYYADVPIQKYAAMFVGRDEDTIIRWKQKDSKFADAIQRAKAEWVRKKVIATKAEFALERLEAEIFSPAPTILSSSSVYVAPTDPNTPENKRLVDEITDFLMEKTKRKSEGVAGQS